MHIPCLKGVCGATSQSTEHGLSQAGILVTLGCLDVCLVGSRGLERLGWLRGPVLPVVGLSMFFMGLPACTSWHRPLQGRSHGSP